MALAEILAWVVSPFLRLRLRRRLEGQLPRAEQISSSSVGPLAAEKSDGVAGIVSVVPPGWELRWAKALLHWLASLDVSWVKALELHQQHQELL